MITAKFVEWAPNVARYWPRLVKAVFETLEMVGISLPIITVGGIALGVGLVVISEGHIYENKTLNGILPRLVNILRAIPFVILIAAILPFTRFLVGTAVGVPGAVIPMIVAMIPFVARQVELALLEIDKGVTAAALCSSSNVWGCSPSTGIIRGSQTRRTLLKTLKTSSSSKSLRLLWSSR